MTPLLLDQLVVRPVLSWLGSPYESRKARIMLLTIAEQESGCEARCQKNDGPARSWWQIEPPTAELVHAKWAPILDYVIQCKLELYYATQLLELNDQFACVVARGLLWLNPTPLPEMGQVEEAWQYYLNTWRPGKPRAGAWSVAYEKAISVVKAA